MGGISRPSALAVCRLITNSNLVLQDWQVGGLGTLEDLTGIDAGLTKHVHIIGPIAHQPTGFGKVASAKGCRKPIAHRECRELDAAAGEEPVGGNEECVGPVAHEGGEGRLDLTVGAGVENLNLQSEGTCSCRYVS